MKLSKARLKQIIKEEVSRVLEENEPWPREGLTAELEKTVENIKGRLERNSDQADEEDNSERRPANDEHLAMLDQLLGMRNNFEAKQFYHDGLGDTPMDNLGDYDPDAAQWIAKILKIDAF